MKIFLDTANLDEIRWALNTGLIDGVTTNPALLARECVDRDHHEHVAELCRAVPGPVTVQVISVDADGMYREGKDLAHLSDRVVVEVPMIEEGLVAARRLVSDGVAINVTLVFSASQALLAARTGASYVSPFIGRLDDAGTDGIAVVADIRRIFDHSGVECEVLASSIRTPRRFVDSARTGADVVAVPPAVLRAALVHPLTDLGLDHFLHEWSRQIVKARAGHA
ncbi:MAG: fructose-6-phosphate aldolase [Gemmatimonadaceae bacterium]